MILAEIRDIIRSEATQISKSRLLILNELATRIVNELKIAPFIDLIFICTHNSRRSQMAEFWLSTWLNKFAIKDIYTYSGGTETTALNSRVVQAMQGLGIQVESIHSGSNPIYILNKLNKLFFSKKYDSTYNPKTGFIPIMVCDHADQNCPIIYGSKMKFSLNYIDPKRSDDLPEEENTYKKSLLEIGSEMYYLAHKINTTMELPKIAGNTPVKVELEAGKKYAWCSCGLSSTQPFCDGQHRGTDFAPYKFVAEESKTVFLCSCKKTKNNCYCDGSHKAL